ncbi:hypothetical protein DPMN_045668 [Dreissena polymorpha]|uniref:Uncharacterized protein n=1 Tax=Dreissena polymorpha TaxID=45954 RepID=A0A9D4D6R9_DREPO|nr:hypothetical protein DPMN_045668 [Dreissena polymorpha]
MNTKHLMCLLVAAAVLLAIAPAANARYYDYGYDGNYGYPGNYGNSGNYGYPGYNDNYYGGWLGKLFGGWGDYGYGDYGYDDYGYGK